MLHPDGETMAMVMEEREPCIEKIVPFIPKIKAQGNWSITGIYVSLQRNIGCHYRGLVASHSPTELRA